MKKSMLNLGRALNKTEQKQINGGFGVITHEGDECAENGNGVANGCHCVSNSQCASRLCSNFESGHYTGGICITL